MEILKEYFLYNAKSPLIFTEQIFWVFFGIVMLVFSLIYKNKAWRNGFLFLASLFFYYKTSGFFFSILLFSTLTDFGIGIAIYNATTQIAKKWWLALSITLNLGVLIYFKYAYFFADSFNRMIGSQYHPINHFADLSNKLLGTGFRVDQILLPVGISFFTFQTMSYAIDIYRGQLKPVRSIFDFGFYVSFFPQLVAGPIVRASDFIPQLFEPYRLTKQQFGIALFWIMNGLIKKVLLADYIALNFVDRVFGNPGSYTGFENLMALYGYSLQVYADFSGYTDMAIGIALLMGFRLPLNFNSPYKADSCANFWKRWHISLSTWLKDYLYIPLGGNRGGTLFTYIALGFIAFFVYMISGSWAVLASMALFAALAILTGMFVPPAKRWFTTNINLLITMLFGGLWHGASWNFVLWGGLNGLGIVVYKLWRKVSPWEDKTKWYNRLIAIFITFNFISFTRIWFRSSSANSWDSMKESHDISSEWSNATTMLNQLVTKMDFSVAMEVITGFAPVFGVMTLGFIIHWLPESWKNRYRYFFANQGIFVQVLAAVLGVFLVYQVMSADAQPFIYFQF